MAHSQLLYVSPCEVGRKVAPSQNDPASRRRVELRAFEALRLFVVSEWAGGIGSAGGFCLGGDEVMSVPAICSSGRGGGGDGRVGGPPVISGQKSSLLPLF